MRILPCLVAATAISGLLSCSDQADSVDSTAPESKSLGAFVTSQPAQARTLVPQARLKPILSVGDPLPGQENNADPEQRVWAPIPDGLGAFAENGNLVLFANHEIASSGVDGRFPFSRVSRLVLDPNSLEVKSASYPITGKAAGFLFQRLCSATFIGPEEGFGSGWFFTGEESTTGGAEGIQLAVANDGSETRRLPWLGRMAHENYIAVPGFGNRVVMIGTDDNSPASLGAAGRSEFYLYVANDDAGVLNGTGKLFVFRTSEATDPADLEVGQTIGGEFVEVTDPGALSAEDLQTAVDQLGAFKFVRLEDIDYARDRSPGRGRGRSEQDPLVYFVDTGNINAQCDGAPCDLFGSIYSMRLDADDPTSNARLVLLARSTGAPDGFASPDNIAVSRKSLMVQEDPAYAEFNRPERIWNFPIKQNGTLGQPRAVVELLTEQFTGNVCSEAAGTCWETSGVIDASQWLGAGTWLFDVQAHTLPFSFSDGQATVNITREGGQLLFLRLPGS